MEALPEPQVFVPAFPTCAPGMLVRRRDARQQYPLSSPTIRFSTSPATPSGRP